MQELLLYHTSESHTFLFRRCKDSKTDAIAHLVRNVVKGSTIYDFQTLVSLAVQDRGAIKIAEYLDLMEREGCDMHDGDKIEDSALGNLIRSKVKKK